MNYNYTKKLIPVNFHNVSLTKYYNEMHLILLQLIQKGVLSNLLSYCISVETKITLELKKGKKNIIKITKRAKFLFYLCGK